MPVIALRRAGRWMEWDGVCLPEDSREGGGIFRPADNATRQYQPPSKILNRQFLSQQYLGLMCYPLGPECYIYIDLDMGQI